MSTDTLLSAVRNLGGVSRTRVERSGLLSEWMQLPGPVRSQVFRSSSTQDPEEIASQLRQAGYPSIMSGDDLLQWLLDPAKRGFQYVEVTTKELMEQYREEAARLTQENHELRARLEQYEGTTFEPEIMQNQNDFHKSMGRSGGKARARNLSPERRSEIARNAAIMRHQKRKEVAA